MGKRDFDEIDESWDNNSNSPSSNSNNNIQSISTNNNYSNNGVDNLSSSNNNINNNITNLSNNNNYQLNHNIDSNNQNTNNNNNHINLFNNQNNTNNYNNNEQFNNSLNKSGNNLVPMSISSNITSPTTATITTTMMSVPPPNQSSPSSTNHPITTTTTTLVSSSVRRRGDRKRTKFPDDEVKVLCDLVVLFGKDVRTILTFKPFAGGKYSERQIYDKVRALKRSGLVPAHPEEDEIKRARTDLGISDAVDIQSLKSNKKGRLSSFANGSNSSGSTSGGGNTGSNNGASNGNSDSDYSSSDHDDDDYQPPSNNTTNLITSKRATIIRDSPTTTPTVRKSIQSLQDNANKLISQITPHYISNSSTLTSSNQSPLSNSGSNIHNSIIPPNNNLTINQPTTRERDKEKQLERNRKIEKERNDRLDQMERDRLEKIERKKEQLQKEKEREKQHDHDQLMNNGGSDNEDDESDSNGSSSKTEILNNNVFDYFSTNHNVSLYKSKASPSMMIPSPTSSITQNSNTVTGISSSTKYNYNSYNPFLTSSIINQPSSTSSPSTSTSSNQLLPITTSIINAVNAASTSSSASSSTSTSPSTSLLTSGTNLYHSISSNGLHHNCNNHNNTNNTNSFFKYETDNNLFIYYPFFNQSTAKTNFTFENDLLTLTVEIPSIFDWIGDKQPSNVDKKIKVEFNHPGKNYGPPRRVNKLPDGTNGVAFIFEKIKQGCVDFDISIL